MKKTLATEAKRVSQYLTEYNNMLVKVINSKGIDKKDAKWLKECVMSIMQTQSILDVAVAYNSVMKTYTPKKRKNVLRALNNRKG